MKHLSFCLFPPCYWRCFIEFCLYLVMFCFAGCKCPFIVQCIFCGLIDSECWMHYLWTALSVCLLGFPDNVQPTKEFIYISEEPSYDSGVHLKLSVFLSIFSFLSCKASFVPINSDSRSAVNCHCSNSCLVWAQGIWY